eukprot:gnl/MRDRNA2_/MRDRNA2_133974_c0_seq1.p1 gnl/MRDRNA2_/MRDRNA2_133974_c0~~gnl/MRDRNA2_/MRDRNA2_133974_c0_seq1.p1  ORF type:complete len:195 (+),score=22.82 gnl/MRDRNA2_/MRDRNA2_133974_c0_seq1:84-668(+)
MRDAGAPLLPTKAIFIALFPVLCIQLAIWRFIYGALKPFTAPGESVFQIKAFPAKGLSANCVLQYDALHIWWITLIGYIFISILLLILMVTRLCTGDCSNKVRFLFNLALVWNFVHAVQATFKASDYSQCEYLHNVAWWVVCGIPLMFLCVVLVLFALLIMVAKRRAQRAQARGTVVTPAIGEAPYQKLPGAEV